MYLITHPGRWLIAAIILLFLFLSWFLSPNPKEQAELGDKLYPWNIQLNDLGHNRVFGVTLGVDSWLDVNKHFNKYGKLAVFDDGGGNLSLEGFLGDITLSGITGRVIIGLEADSQLLMKLQQGARKQETQKSGAIRYTIDHNQRRDIVDLKVKSLTYIPRIDLDEELIRQRFDDPERIIVMPNGLRHFIYPQKGLDIIVDNDGKEVLQYVVPAQMPDVIEPLRAKGGKDE